MKIKAKFSENADSDVWLNTFQKFLDARQTLKKRYNCNYSVKINPIEGQIALVPSEEVIDFSYSFSKVVIK